jgi:5-methylcytosine-specific restriction endonuclease McrA
MVQTDSARQGRDTDSSGAGAPYRTAAWKALRDVVFRRDGGCCQRCGSAVRGRDWRIGHRRPHGGDPALFWAEKNLQLECANCTRVKLRRAGGQWIDLAAEAQGA